MKTLLIALFLSVAAPAAQAVPMPPLVCPVWP